MSVGYLPYGLPAKRYARIAAIPLDCVQWPHGKPALQDSVGKIGDLTRDDDLVLCLSSKALLANLRGLKCRVSLMAFEPPVIQGRCYRALPYFAKRFHRIFTHNSDLLRRIPNARFQVHGGAMTKIPNAFPEKTARVSLIASNKRSTVGHRLRHRIVRWSTELGLDVAIMGRGYRSIENKAEGHWPFQFSVVIENCREPGYFTEKLIDSFLGFSVPIYWGAPDVTRHFDPRGMILCSSEEELKQAILRVDDNEFSARLPYLRKNHKLALSLADPWTSIAEQLEWESPIGHKPDQVECERIAA